MSELDGLEMSEAKDPTIKLFGKTIPLSDCQIPAGSGHKSDPATVPQFSHEEDECGESIHEEVTVSILSIKEEPSRPNCSSDLKDDVDENKATGVNDKSSADPQHDEEEMETDAASGEEKGLKKMDKIIPCPRCHSMETKFCYYNNYNVNQPRHFCKNCQRYWTAGGTMRNVPVGAGRRKNKHPMSQYHHMVRSSDGMPVTHVNPSNLVPYQVLPIGLPPSNGAPKGNGTILRFGPDVPLCDSMATVLNLGDKKTKADQGLVSCSENGEEPSCSSSITASTCLENEVTENFCQMEHGCKRLGSNGFSPTHHFHCHPVNPWAGPWSPAWNNVTAIAPGRCSSELIHKPENGNPGPVQWSSTPTVAAPALCAPNVSFPLVHAPYWGTLPGWTGGAWNVPYARSDSGASQSSANGCSVNCSPTLGKHSRDTNFHGEEKEKCLWVPKTLRIDDPNEVVKSSIWVTLGIKHEPNEYTAQSGIYKTFQPMIDTQQVLRANPAALSRSNAFQEST